MKTQVRPYTKRSTSQAAHLLVNGYNVLIPQYRRDGFNGVAETESKFQFWLARDIIAGQYRS